MTDASKPVSSFTHAQAALETAQDILSGRQAGSVNRIASHGRDQHEVILSGAMSKDMAYAGLDGTTHDLTPKAKRAPGQPDATAVAEADRILAGRQGKPLTANRVVHRI